MNLNMLKLRAELTTYRATELFSDTQKNIIKWSSGSIVESLNHLAYAPEEESIYVTQEGKSFEFTKSNGKWLLTNIYKFITLYRNEYLDGKCRASIPELIREDLVERYMAFNEDDGTYDVSYSTTQMKLDSAQEFYFILENGLEGFDTLPKTFVEHGELYPSYYNNVPVLINISQLKKHDIVYVLDAGAYSMYRVD